MGIEKTDKMRYVTGAFALIMALVVILVALFGKVSDANIFYFIAGWALSNAGTVVNHYYSSSIGSTTKQNTINKYLDKEVKK